MRLRFYVYVCMHARMHVCVYVCMCIYVLTYPPPTLTSARPPTWVWEVVRTVAAPPSIVVKCGGGCFFVWSFVVLFLSCRVLCCCGVVLVVSCVVLYLLYACIFSYLPIHPVNPLFCSEPWQHASTFLCLCMHACTYVYVCSCMYVHLPTYLSTSHADFGAATHPGVGGGTHRRRATFDRC